MSVSGYRPDATGLSGSSGGGVMGASIGGGAPLEVGATATTSTAVLESWMSGLESALPWLQANGGVAGGPRSQQQLLTLTVVAGSGLSVLLLLLALVVQLCLYFAPRCCGRSAAGASGRGGRGVRAGAPARRKASSRYARVVQRESWEPQWEGDLEGDEGDKPTAHTVHGTPIASECTLLTDRAALCVVHRRGGGRGGGGR
jgi:hypothetical protein